MVLIGGRGWYICTSAARPTVICDLDWLWHGDLTLLRDYDL